MRAVMVESYDGFPFPLRETESPDALGAEEILVAVHTAPVNFADTLVARGLYQFRPDLPFTPCGECSGVIEQVGSAVRDFSPGDRVACMGPRVSAHDRMKIAGTLAEKTVVDACNPVKIPDGLSLEQAALFRSNYETASYGLHHGQLKAGETLLVLGAGGGAGFAAVSMGKALGATVIGSASTADRRDHAKLAGADHVIDSQAQDWRAQVDALTGGRGLDCVYDPVGGDATERAFRALGFRGRHVVIGFAAGTIPRLPVNLALMKAASLVGANMLRGIREEPEVTAMTSARAWDLLRAGRLVLPRIARRYPLERASEAMEAVASGECAGRVVVSVNPALDSG
jgi:NADPH2:quinone reductase